ncbi:hypothetical protein Droror1_Dr00024317 [Drosera rotundifolia]
MVATRARVGRVLSIGEGSRGCGCRPLPRGEVHEGMDAHHFLGARVLDLERTPQRLLRLMQLDPMLQASLMQSGSQLEPFVVAASRHHHRLLAPYHQRHCVQPPGAAGSYAISHQNLFHSRANFTSSVFTSSRAILLSFTQSRATILAPPAANVTVVIPSLSSRPVAHREDQTWSNSAQKLWPARVRTGLTMGSVLAQHWPDRVDL